MTALHNLIMKFAKFSLEAELVSLVGDGTNASMAARYFGLDGRGGTTLQVVGDEFGLTRERIRQVVTRITRRFEGKVPFAPALDAAIKFVVERSPGRAEGIEVQMHESGLTQGISRLEGVIEAAKFLGRTPPFRVTETRGERIVHSEAIESAEKIVQIGVLAGESGFQWLDRPAGWFWVASVPRNSLVNRIEKILSIANPIRVSELRAESPETTGCRDSRHPLQCSSNSVGRYLNSKSRIATSGLIHRSTQGRFSGALRK